MKKLTTLMLLALSVIMLTQCKKEKLEENNASSGEKVKVRCEIPLGNGAKSDFTNILEDGSIRWSAEKERVYLAIDGENHQIVELSATPVQTASSLVFEGSVVAGLLEEGIEYQLWYFGNSMNSGTPYVTANQEGSVITSVNGSIANQSGKLDDLGYHHIAMTTVMAVESENGINLPLQATLQNQMAIAYMDLSRVTTLTGSAIIGTEYALQYNTSTSEYEFAVTEESYSKISVTSGTEESFVVLLPEAQSGAEIKCYKATAALKTIFTSGVYANKLYYGDNANGDYGVLTWYVDENAEPDEHDPYINGHEYVDLGLPSGLKWATCNVGDYSPEEYYNMLYYDWGGTEPMQSPAWDWDYENAADGKTIEQLQNAGIIDDNNHLAPSYDPATLNWGGTWRLPTNEEMQELVDKCNWKWITWNEEYEGYKVTGPNGNSIFLPAMGMGGSLESDLIFSGEYGYYWSSSPDESDTHNAYGMLFSRGSLTIGSYNRTECRSVRPVSD